MQRLAFPTFLMLLILTGCSDRSSETGPGGVSADDAQALDEAAAKLDREATGEPASNISN